MRRIDLQLFGALRDAVPGGRLAIDVEGGRIADLRAAVQSHADAQWPATARSLIARSAFASTTQVLRDAEGLPADGELALLPPVSGG